MTKKLMREVKLLSRLNHENVVRYIGQIKNLFFSYQLILMIFDLKFKFIIISVIYLFKILHELDRSHHHGGRGGWGRGQQHRR